MNLYYEEFLKEYRKYDSFITQCFKTYTKNWKGYPSVESTNFTDKGINLTYNVWDENDDLFIPVEFVINNDVAGVVKLWSDKAEKERQENLAKQKAQHEADERAELARLQEKYK